MIISLIAAMDKNRVIGKSNALPWKLPADMLRFRDITFNKPIIMGRKTHESIGRALPNRKNIIITRDENYVSEDCDVVHSVDDALALVEEDEEVMIIGGQQIYQLLLPLARRMYLTIIDEEFEGDAYFPEYDKEKWHVIEREVLGNDDKNPYGYEFLTLERKQV